MFNTSSVDSPDLPEPDGPAFLVSVCGPFQGRGLRAEFKGDRLRVTRKTDPDGPAVELECRRRASDADRWWFVLGGAWICVADKTYEILGQVGSALYQATDPGPC